MNVLMEASRAPVRGRGQLVIHNDRLDLGLGGHAADVPRSRMRLQDSLRQAVRFAGRRVGLRDSREPNRIQ